MTEQKELKGLSSEEAKILQERFGKNELTAKKEDNFFLKILHVISEPMFLLLIIASLIYFILGEPRNGGIMLIFVIGIISIDAIQEWKTDKTLRALKNLSAPCITVIRDGIEQNISSVDLVPGDIMLLAEGVKIPADGKVLKVSTFCVDESTLTGESEGVFKTALEDNQSGYWRRDYCYAGTLVTQGTATIQVEKIGTDTEYGKIGKNVAEAPEHPSLLQKQTRKLVKMSAIFAAILLVLVGIITYFNIPDHAFKDRVTESILSGITLAMAMIPEEFPVILTVFLSMGAWRLAKKKSLVRKLSSVETLGAVSVLCVDKTGTITQNKMTVRELWNFKCGDQCLTRIMGLGCEPDAYDPMEHAMISYCNENGFETDELFSGELIYDYAFTDQLKMMGHVWKKENEIFVAAKGSPERILTLCELSADENKLVQEKITQMSMQGLRVIAVGEMKLNGENQLPEKLTDCTLAFCGLVGLYDPPRESVKQDIEKCTKAGVRVVMITGDNGVTASSIAKQIGMPNCDYIITGEEINHMTDIELREKVKNVSIFSRVIPEHKMRIVKAFKENGEVVAMTGDGVNDAPALKYADIGIAMGMRGSEVSRESADLILLDDNFSTIVDTIKDGRRIYDNIKKAIGYVFTIHIPIAFASLLAPLLGIPPSSLLLLPLHVVLLELLIDPTCSIVLERQPAEKNIMSRPPRSPREKLFSVKLLFKSVLQGFIIFGASFGTYYSILIKNPENAPLARAMGICIILFANVFFVQINSSNSELAIKSMFYLIRDKVIWIINLATIAGIIIILYTPLNTFLKLSPLNLNQFLIVAVIAFVSTFWYELVKLFSILRNKYII